MMSKTQRIKRIVAVLHEKGFRATTSRIQLLLLLEKLGTPVSVQKIAESWDGKAPNLATLYRSLTDLNEVEIVHRIDLNANAAHFEYAPDRPHHHHIVCNDCGKVEELDHCAMNGMEQELIHKSKHFKKIYSHNLEFFGHCTACMN